MLCLDHDVEAPPAYRPQLDTVASSTTGGPPKSASMSTSSSDPSPPATAKSAPATPTTHPLDSSGPSSVEVSTGIFMNTISATYIVMMNSKYCFLRMLLSQTGSSSYRLPLAVLVFVLIHGDGPSVYFNPYTLTNPG